MKDALVRLFVALVLLIEYLLAKAAFRDTRQITCGGDANGIECVRHVQYSIDGNVMFFVALMVLTLGLFVVYIWPRKRRKRRR